MTPGITTWPRRRTRSHKCACTCPLAPPTRRALTLSRPATQAALQAGINYVLLYAQRGQVVGEEDGKRWRLKVGTSKRGKGARLHDHAKLLQTWKHPPAVLAYVMPVPQGTTGEQGEKAMMRLLTSSNSVARDARNSIFQATQVVGAAQEGWLGSARENIELSKNYDVSALLEAFRKDMQGMVQEEQTRPERSTLPLTDVLKVLAEMAKLTD